MASAVAAEDTVALSGRLQVTLSSLFRLFVVDNPSLVEHFAES